MYVDNAELKEVHSGSMLNWYMFMPASKCVENIDPRPRVGNGWEETGLLG